MPSFSATSLTRLSECHEDLQKIAHEAIKIYDFLVGTGFRNEIDQNKAFAERKSKLKWPMGKHNKILSEAYDLYPYPFDGSNKPDNINRFYFMAGVMLSIAEYLYEKGEITHKLRWGGDFNHNVVFTDDKWDDLPHFEIYLEE